MISFIYLILNSIQRLLELSIKSVEANHKRALKKNTGLPVFLHGPLAQAVLNVAGRHASVGVTQVMDQRNRRGRWKRLLLKIPEGFWVQDSCHAIGRKDFYYYWIII